jgi:hypothetical protein
MKLGDYINPFILIPKAFFILDGFIVGVGQIYYLTLTLTTYIFIGLFSSVLLLIGFFF